MQQVVAQLPWGHNIFLMDLVSDKQTRLFYIKKAIEYGWSRNIMVMQIELALHKREGQAITNFKNKLLSPQSDLAHYTLKDPYIFDFLSIASEAVDDLIKYESDQPSIGLILCKSKNNVLAEYTLRDMTKPIGLAEYKLTESLPENLKTALPSIEELEAELSKDFNGSKDAVLDKDVSVRSASLSDITHIVRLSYNKRRAYEKAQPRFWRYAEGAEKSQSKWFSELLLRDDYILLVAESENKVLGFIIGQLIKAPKVYNPGGLTLMIDDFCVETAADWSSIGDALLIKLKQLAKEKSATQLILVTGHHDEPKRDFLRDSSLVCVSEWHLGEIDF